MIKEENINCTVEALILASPEPVSVRKICDVLTDISPARVRQAIADLNNIYMGCGNSFRIREIAGGYQFYILPDFEQPIRTLLIKQRTVRLSRAALEALSIIAYKQPVTKTEIEHIRGVSSDGVIHNLLQRKLIAISGRSETPGRPLLYKTSDEFLKFFGLNRISDLPRMDEIEEMIRQAESSKDQTELPLPRDEAEVDRDDRSEIGDSGTPAEFEDGGMPVTADILDASTADKEESAEDEVLLRSDTSRESETVLSGAGMPNEENVVEEIVAGATSVDSHQPDPSDAGDESLQVREKATFFSSAGPLENYEPIPDEPPPVFSHQKGDSNESDTDAVTEEDSPVTAGESKPN